MHWKKLLSKIYVHTLAVLLLFMCQGVAQAQNGPVCDNYSHFFNDGSIITFRVFVDGTKVYAATNQGLYISTNGGSSFTQATNLNSYDVFAVNNNVYVGTDYGLGVSTNGGATFDYKTVANGLGQTATDGVVHIMVNDVYVVGSTVYAATDGGLSISTDGGNTFTNKTTTNGLNENFTKTVYVLGSKIYVGTINGINVSTDGGNTFSTRYFSNDIQPNSIYAIGSKVYVATLFGGFVVSSDGGNIFSTSNVLPTSGMYTSVHAIGNTVYVTSFDAFYISTDGGTSFTNYSTSNGLANVTASSTSFFSVFATSRSIYISLYDMVTNGIAVCTQPCTPSASTETISSCGSYTWHGTTYTASNNTATWTGINAAGCDSVVTLHLTVNPNHPSFSYTSLSSTEAVTWHGQTYSSSGSYQWTGTNAAGCDSIVTLTLTINPIELINVRNVCAYVGTNQVLTYRASDTTYRLYIWSIPGANVVTDTLGRSSQIKIKLLSGFATQNQHVITVSYGGFTESFDLKTYSPGTPSPIVASSTDVCAVLGTNTSITYKIPLVREQPSGAPTATSYIWTASHGSMHIEHPNGSGLYDTIVKVTFDAPGFLDLATLQVMGLNACGTSGTRSIYIYRNNPTQPSLISGPTNACEYMGETGRLATYSVNAIPNVSYTWSLPYGAFAVTGQGTNSISFKYPAGFRNGSVSLSAANGCGISSPRSLSVTNLGVGTPGIFDVIRLQNCPYRIYSYTIASLPSNATSLLWTVPQAGTIISGQGTRSITVSYPGTAVYGDVTVRGVANCGMGSARTITIRIPPLGICPPGVITNKGLMSTTPSAMDVKVFPNPTTSSFNLQVITADSKEVQVKILDVQGRCVKSLIVAPYATVHIGNELKSGVYMVETRQGGEVKTVRVVKY